MLVVLHAIALFADDQPPVITFSVSSPQQITETSNLVFEVTVTDAEEASLTLDLTLIKVPSPIHIEFLVRLDGHNGSFGYSAMAGTSLNSPYYIGFVANDGVNPPVTNIMTIVVLPPPPPAPVPVELTDARFFTETSFAFRINSQSSDSVNIIEASTNLVDWSVIGTNHGGLKLFIDSNLEGPTRFYRARTSQP
ncbi:MAG: hypothetical protein JWM68_4997 [Verrucomicrobiales bacterium]|nr:hypothetical protein [Verrucomicrobiales bacterium]